MLRLLRAEAGSMISIILPMVFHGKELIYKLEITRNPSNYRSCRNSGFAGLFFVVFSSWGKCWCGSVRISGDIIYCDYIITRFGCISTTFGHDRLWITIYAIYKAHTALISHNYGQLGVCSRATITTAILDPFLTQRSKISCQCACFMILVLKCSSLSLTTVTMVTRQTPVIFKQLNRTEVLISPNSFKFKLFF